MKARPSSPKPQRCAIYTRKSTDHNLDLAFNSLDAQREACEAYIKSQAHEGWILIPSRFDDGAFSGASLDRPALQELLEAVRARKVDIIVVYKVDRLTRSLADFAKLVELFDAHEVSFVSVTQSFNTTSSMGRLTLNVLLSFAQFEREVIGERVRDKISASKRKGIWVGGPVPLGYRSVDKRLAVVPEDAMLVRKIFYDYLSLGSIGALAASLEAEGIKPRPRKLSNGQVIAAERFMVGPLAHLLKNRFYIGQVSYRGETHLGEHQPILDRQLFEAVQEKLAEGAHKRRVARSQSPATLMGLIFDDRGNPMSPSHTIKKGVRYRYYVSHALLQNRKDVAGSVTRVSGPDVEASVLDAIRSSTPENVGKTDHEVISAHVQRVRISRTMIEVSLKPANEKAEDVSASAQTVSIPFSSARPLQKGMTHTPGNQESMSAETRESLLQAISRSRRWMERLLSGEVSSIDEIASAEKLAERHVRFLLPLAFLSPRIIAAIANGTAPADLNVSKLARALPHAWAEQERGLLKA